MCICVCVVFWLFMCFFVFWFKQFVSSTLIHKMSFLAPAWTPTHRLSHTHHNLPRKLHQQLSWTIPEFSTDTNHLPLCSVENQLQQSPRTSSEAVGPGRDGHTVHQLELPAVRPLSPLSPHEHLKHHRTSSSSPHAE